MLRISTPIAQIKVTDIPSPSENKEDQLLLPHFSSANVFNPYDQVKNPQDTTERLVSKQSVYSSLEESKANLERNKETAEIRKCNAKLNRLLLGSKKINYVDSLIAKRNRSVEYQQRRVDMSAIIARAAANKRKETK